MQHYTREIEVNEKKIVIENENEAIFESRYHEQSILTTNSTPLDRDQSSMQIKYTNSRAVSPAHTIEDTTYETPIITSDTNLLMNSENPEVTQTSTFYIIDKIWVWITVILITFVVCLSVFPSIAALVDSTEKGNVSESIIVIGQNDKCYLFLINNYCSCN